MEHIHSFNKYVMEANYMPQSLQDAKDLEVSSLL